MRSSLSRAEGTRRARRRFAYLHRRLEIALPDRARAEKNSQKIEDSSFYARRIDPPRGVCHQGHHTPPNAIVFGSGYLTIPQMVKAGLWMNLIGIALVTLVPYFIILPLVGAGR